MQVKKNTTTEVANFYFKKTTCQKEEGTSRISLITSQWATEDLMPVPAITAPASAVTEATAATSTIATAASAPASTVAEATAAAAGVGLVAQNGRLAAVAAARAAAACGHVLEHGRILQHVGQNEETDLAAAHVDVFQLRHPTISARKQTVFVRTNFPKKVLLVTSVLMVLKCCKILHYW